MKNLFLIGHCKKTEKIEAVSICFETASFVEKKYVFRLSFP